MLKNYIRIAFRLLWRKKTSSFVNIVGLAVGMAACFLIFIYVHFETSFDRFHTKADRIYRLTCDIVTPTGTNPRFSTSFPTGPALKREFPEVEGYVRMINGDFLVRRGVLNMREDNGAMADSSVFSLFDFPLIKGDPRTALKEANSLVLSETAAKKYFGQADPIGQHLILQDGLFTATVTGIMKDLPRNSQIRTDFFLSSTAMARDSSRDSNWGGFGPTTYLLLKPGADPAKLATKFPDFVERHMADKMKERGEHYSLGLEPLTTVYLHSPRGGYVTGNSKNVYFFSAIAFFIILIAGINFVNLATASATARAKEVGIRKISGAGRSQLIFQFMGESILLCIIASVLALFLVFCLLPGFNELAGKTVSQSLFQDRGMIFLLLLIAAGSGMLAGIFPAFVLSAFKPALALKGRFATGKTGGRLRRALVVAQFGISIFLIVATIVVASQLRYMRDQALGFDNMQTLVFNTNMLFNQTGRSALQQEIDAIPGVRGTCYSAGIPGDNYYPDPSKIENRSGEMQEEDINVLQTDFDFIPQYGLKMVAGRAFSKDFATDSLQAVILNETAIRDIGYASPGDALGKRFVFRGDTSRIVGVAGDFHFQSLQQFIRPTALRVDTRHSIILSVKVEPVHLPATIAAIGNAYSKFVKDYPFSYYFADEFFNRQYLGDQRFGRLFLYFALLAIFISCLGLFGLASYSTLQRTREIGVRKVLGASVAGIVNLLTRDFLRLVCVALLVASPLAWLAMNRWLQDYAYRVPVGLWIFGVAGLIALVTAFLTVSFQAIAAAVANPVKALRSE